MLFRRRVTETGLLYEAQLDAIDAEAVEEIKQAVAQAKATPCPDARDLLTDVYVSY